MTLGVSYSQNPFGLFVTLLEFSSCLSGTPSLKLTQGSTIGSAGCQLGEASKAGTNRPPLNSARNL